MELGGRHRAQEGVLEGRRLPSSRMGSHGGRPPPPPHHLLRAVHPLWPLLGLRQEAEAGVARGFLLRSRARGAGLRRSVHDLQSSRKRIQLQLHVRRRITVQEAWPEDARPEKCGERAKVGRRTARRLGRHGRLLPLLLLYLLRLRVEHGEARLRQHVRAHRHIPAAVCCSVLDLQHRGAQHPRLRDRRRRGDRRSGALCVRVALRGVLENSDEEKVKAPRRSVLLGVGFAYRLREVDVVLVVLAGAGGAHRKLLRGRRRQSFQQTPW